jgi:hypothetical protein
MKSDVFPFLQTKVFRSDRDLIGVLTFGTTKKVPASLDFNHLCLNAELDRPSVESILALERLLGDDGRDIFEKELGSKGRVSIHEVLWYSQSLFASVKERLFCCCVVPYYSLTYLDFFS